MSTHVSVRSFGKFEVHVVSEKGDEDGTGNQWVASTELSDVLCLSTHTIRGKLNKLKWEDRKEERDPDVLRSLCDVGVLGGGEMTLGGTLGHTRCATLLRLDTLSELVLELKPAFRHIARALRRGLEGQDQGQDQEEEKKAEDVEVIDLTLDDSGDEEDEEEIEYEGGHAVEVEEGAVEVAVGVAEEEEEEEEESDDDDVDFVDGSGAGKGKGKQKSKRSHYGLKEEHQTPELKHQLAELEQWMTENLRLDRQAGRFAGITFSSTKSVLLRYLGYLETEKKIQEPDLTALADPEPFVEFLSWLLDTRGLLPQTLGNYISSVITALKFLSKDSARAHGKYEDIEAIGKLRDLRDQTQKLVQFWKPPTTEMMEKMRKCLPWAQIVDATSKLLQLFHEAPADTKDKAVALQKYLMIAFFVYFPPVRAGPIRQLEIGKSLVKTEKDGWVIDARAFKTFAKYGATPTPLHPRLVEPVEAFIDTYRPMLLSADSPDHTYFFVNTSGQPFDTPSSWTRAMQSIFEGVTGVKVGNNILRHSFVTHALSADASKALKRSVADHMGHSVETAKRTYNLNARQAGLGIAAEWAREIPAFRQGDEKEEEGEATVEEDGEGEGEGEGEEEEGSAVGEGEGGGGEDEMEMCDETHDPNSDPDLGGGGGGESEIPIPIEKKPVAENRGRHTQTPNPPKKKKKKQRTQRAQQAQHTQPRPPSPLLMPLPHPTSRRSGRTIKQPDLGDDTYLYL